MIDLASQLKDAGHTDASLAAKVGCSRPHITKIKRGDRTPSLKIAVALERETGIPAAKWLGEAA